MSRHRSASDSDDASEDDGLPHSSFKGVSWDVTKRKWIAEIWDGDEFQLVGEGDEEEAAARAYDRACLRHAGAEANINFPVTDYEDELAAAALLSVVHDNFSDLANLFWQIHEERMRKTGARTASVMLLDECHALWVIL